MAIKGVIRPGLGESLKHRVGPCEQDAITGAAGGVSQGTSQVSLAYAHRAGEDDVLFAFDEVKSKELIQSCFIQCDVRAPVEAFECTFLLKAGLIQTGLNRNLLPPLGLVAENEFEQFGVIEFLVTGERQTVWQGVQHRRQLQPFQCCFQFG